MGPFLSSQSAASHVPLPGRAEDRWPPYSGSGVCPKTAIGAIACDVPISRQDCSYVPSRSRLGCRLRFSDLAFTDRSSFTPPRRLSAQVDGEHSDCAITN